MADETSGQTAAGEQTAAESGIIDFNAEAVRLGDHIVRGRRQTARCGPFR